MYSELALRELIANALIHKDFTVTGAGPMVEIYDDRIEVTTLARCCPARNPIVSLARPPNRATKNWPLRFGGTVFAKSEEPDFRRSFGPSNCSVCHHWS